LTYWQGPELEVFSPRNICSTGDNCDNQLRLAVQLRYDMKGLRRWRSRNLPMDSPSPQRIRAEAHVKDLEASRTFIMLHGPSEFGAISFQHISAIQQHFFGSDFRMSLA